MVIELFQNELVVNSAAAGIIVIAGFIIGHFFSKAVGLGIRKSGLAEKIKQKGWPKPEVMIENAIKYIIYAFAIIAALNRLGLFETVFNIAIFVSLAILVIFILLNFKDVISNAVARILYSRKDLKPGKRIKVDDIAGRVVSVGITQVKITTDRGNIIVLPNAYLLKRSFIVENDHRI